MQKGLHNINQIIIEYFVTPYGELILGDYRGELCLCDWKFRSKRDAIDERLKVGLNAEYVMGSSVLLDKTKEQLNEYFHKERTVFSIPIILVGTEFQKSVWLQLLMIPFGISKTYLTLTKELGSQKAIRAVASANGANAISIIVPCHRIIGSNGELIGYAGGVQSKKKLLSLENAMLNNQYNLF